MDNRTFVMLGIRRANGDYTNLGLLLYGQSPIQAKVAEYDDKLYFRIKRTYSGSLLKVIRDVQDMCERLNDVSAVIDGSSFERKQTISYPGARIDEITLGMQNESGPQTPDSIYNQIKRYLRDYLGFKGPKKSGGYHLK